MQIVIPIAPVTKKNHQSIVRAKGRLMVVPSKQFTGYQKACEPYMPNLDAPIDYPIELACKFYMPTHRRVDAVNLMQAVCDILVKYKVIADDNSNIIASFDGTRVLYDKEQPRTEITITPINCSGEDR